MDKMIKVKHCQMKELDNIFDSDFLRSFDDELTLNRTVSEIQQLTLALPQGTYNPNHYYVAEYNRPEAEGVHHNEIWTKKIVS